MSHSGSLDSFTPRGDDSFGLPPMTIDSLIFLNDTTIVQISSIGGDWHVQKDTIINHPLQIDESVSVDSMKYYYRYDDTKFVGFDEKEKCPAPSSSLNNDIQNADASSEIIECDIPALDKKDVLRDSVQVDTLVKPIETIKSRGDSYKNDSIAPISSSDMNGGTSFFQLTVVALFLASFSFFIFLNYRQTKLA